MTSVYGITLYTAKQHLIEYFMKNDILPLYRIKEGSNYLVKQIFDCLKDLFYNTNKLQKWLINVAMEIGQSVSPSSQLLLKNGQGIYPDTFLTWTTPLGYQVTQPYLVYESQQKQQIKTGKYFLLFSSFLFKLLFCFLI